MTHDPAIDLTATSFFIARHEEHFSTSYQSFAVKQLIFHSFPVLNGSQRTIPLPKGLVQISEHSLSDWRMPEF